MMNDSNLTDRSNLSRRYTAYISGFVLSIILTLGAYMLVKAQTGAGVQAHSWLIPAIIALAVAQLFVQVWCFFHLGSESKPRWNLSAFLFMLIIVFILVAGSIWIMNNLAYNHNHLSPTQTDTYIIKDEGIRY